MDVPYVQAAHKRTARSLCTGVYCRLKRTGMNCQVEAPHLAMDISGCNFHERNSVYRKHNLICVCFIYQCSEGRRR